MTDPPIRRRLRNIWILLEATKYNVAAVLRLKITPGVIFRVS
jgi:hypothetical protein